MYHSRGEKYSAKFPVATHYFEPGIDCEIAVECAILEVVPYLCRGGNRSRTSVGKTCEHPLRYR
jgi:hypothetical protein